MAINASDFMDVSQALARMAATPKVVLFLSDDGDSPMVSADRDVNVAVIRQGKDLGDYEDADLFMVLSPGGGEHTQQAAGHMDQVRADPIFVDAIFAAVQAHTAKTAAGQPACAPRDQAPVRTGYEGIAQQCRAVIDCYEAGMSGMDGPQLQNRVNLGDSARWILKAIAKDPAGGWLPLDKAAVARFERNGSSARYWFYGPSASIAVGQYEWRQGSDPERLVGSEIGNRYVFDGAYTHYQPYVVPEPPSVAIVNTALAGGK